MDFLGSVVNNNAMSPAEKQLRPVLCDENIQVLSTFELNQVASLTYNEVTCDGIFEFVQAILCRPLDHTPLTIQKALIVTKHTLVYGSEKTVNHVYGLQNSLRPLLEFNTVLMAQQRGGAMSFFQSLQGGGVDKGGPVREAAHQILGLLGNIPELRRLRLESASEESLVPVGDNGQVAFVTDEVRLQILKRKMAEENRVRISSNLKKSVGGFGGGYASKDGRSVVGAAHGIEEMIKMANISKSKTLQFSDHHDGRPSQKSKEELILEELKAEADAETAKRLEAEARAAATAAANGNGYMNNPYATVNAPSMDLLGSYATPTTTPAHAMASTGGGVDLLDFGGSPSGGSHAVAATATGDLLGGGLLSTGIPMSMPGNAAPADPFGLSTPSYNNNTTAYNTATTAIPNPASTSLLDFSVQNDPFAPPSAARTPASTINDSTGLMSMGMAMNSMNLNTTADTGSNHPGMSASGAMHDITSLSGPAMSMGMPMAAPPPPQPPMGMASNVDRFSALDALAGATPAPTAQDARDAEARLLGFAAAPNNSNSNSNTAAAPAASYSASGATGGMMSMGMGMSTGMSTGMAQQYSIPEPMIAPGSGRVANAYGDASADQDDDNPWVMGGATGMGLEPIGPTPTAPPPPPPPDY